MPAIFFYFIQVMVCSAILYGYYLVVLRNKRFHQYNRFFLLAVMLFSWLLPLIRIPLPALSADEGVVSIKFLDVIADNSAHVERLVTGDTAFDWSRVLTGIYLLGCVGLFASLMKNLFRIYTYLRKHPSADITDAILVYAPVQGTPFSFFRYIFWHTDIDIHSTAGRQILQHELAHVREKHSIDKLVGSIVLIAGWFNPIFWLTKKELDMVHEFIADKRAVDNDAADLARMLLTTSFPSVQLNIVNSFFHSPIKRRLSMITGLNVTKHPYLRRLLVLPLFGVLVILFAFRKQVPEQKHQQLKRTYTVVVEAGHGGYDQGAVANDGTTEASLALQIAKEIKELNTNSQMDIRLVREEDVYIHPKDKAEIIRREKADLFISVHVNSQEKGISTKNGIEIFLPGADTLNKDKQSYILANAIGTYLEKVSPKTTLKVRKTGIWVLQHSNCPSALIECGYITDKNDLRKLKTKEYQQLLAKKILAAAEHYLHYSEE